MATATWRSTCGTTPPPRVLDQYDGEFEIGKGRLLRDGADVIFVSTGFLTMGVLAGLGG